MHYTPSIPSHLAVPALNALPRPVVVVDQACCVRLANQRLYDLCSTSDEDLLGQPLSAVLPEQDGQPGLSAIARESLRTSGESTAECEVALPGAEPRTFSVYAEPVPLSVWAEGAVVLYLEDVTHRVAEQHQLHFYQKRLQRLAVQLATVETREWRRIATELHDRIGQTLSSVQMRIGVLRNAAREQQQCASLQRLYQMVNRCIEDARALTDQVGTPVLYALGLIEAVESLAEQLEREHGVTVTVQDDGQPKPLNEDLLALVFRSIRELLHNVVKHAATDQAQVALRRDGDALIVEISDQGTGFDVRTVLQGDDGATGFGLFSIRERFVSLGGSFSLDSRPGSGTRCRFTAPLEPHTQSSS